MFNKIVMGAGVLFSLLMGPAMAESQAPVVASQGGLKISLPDTPYYFKLSGVFRFDQTLYLGSAQNKQYDFPNSAQLRTAEMTLGGGVTPSLSYEFNLAYKPGAVDVSDAYVRYTGFENVSLMLGQVPPNFSLENSKSSKWLGFLERGLPSSTFAAHYGLGLNARTWGRYGVLGVAVVQPGYDKGSNNLHADKLTTTARAHFAPVHDTGKVVQFGLSAAHREFETQTISRTGAGQKPVMASGVTYKSSFESKSRNLNSNLVSITVPAKYTDTYVGEFAALMGPVYVQAEYFDAHVRPTNRQMAKAHFSGYDVQAKYVLTGEARDYDYQNGTFGRVRPQHKNGAFEVAARYSFVQLNDTNYLGGSAHDATLGLSWYASSNVRVMANYIRSHIHPSNQKATRHVNTLAARLQVFW